MSFPLTDFDRELRFAPKPYAERLEWLMPYGATLVGHSAGPVGPLPADLKPAEIDQLGQMISKLGAQ